MTFSIEETLHINEQNHAIRRPLDMIIFVLGSIAIAVTFFLIVVLSSLVTAASATEKYSFTPPTQQETRS